MRMQLYQKYTGNPSAVYLKDILKLIQHLLSGCPHNFIAGWRVKTRLLMWCVFENFCSLKNFSRNLMQIKNPKHYLKLEGLPTSMSLYIRLTAVRRYLIGNTNRSTGRRNRRQRPPLKPVKRMGPRWQDNRLVTWCIKVQRSCATILRNLGTPSLSAVSVWPSG